MPVIDSLLESTRGNFMLTAECPFCTSNGRVKVLAENREAYLTQVLTSGGEPVPDRYFIIPKQHIESILSLPADWHLYFACLLGKVPGVSEGTSYNLSWNLGAAAGQRVKHVHCWVILRANEDSLPSYETGMSGLIDKVNSSEAPAVTVSRL